MFFCFEARFRSVRVVRRLRGAGVQEGLTAPEGGGRPCVPQEPLQVAGQRRSSAVFGRFRCVFGRQELQQCLSELSEEPLVRKAHSRRRRLSTAPATTMKTAVESIPEDVPRITCLSSPCKVTYHVLHLYTVLVLYMLLLSYHIVYI